MKQLISGLILAVSLLMAPNAIAQGCGNCDFPMAQLYGKWESGNTELILQQRTRTGDEVVVDIALVNSKTGHVIARGQGRGNVQNSDLRVVLVYGDGTRKVFMVSISDSGQLELNLGFSPTSTNCNSSSGCTEFERSSNTQFDSKDLFGESTYFDDLGLDTTY